jgi:hypothetical protein
MDDLILTAMKGAYPWDTLKTFVNSIKFSGYAGQKVMLAHGIDPDVRAELVACGFEVVNYDIADKRTFGSYCSERFWPANTFLRERAQDYRYIIWVDWKDLVVQTDPAMWLQQNLAPYKLVGCTEGLRIAEEYYNDWWLKQAAPDPDTYMRARGGKICCAGTLAGEALAMRDLMCEIYRVLSTSPDKPDYAGGVTPLIDQGVLNYLVRVSPFKEITQIPEMDSGFCATCNWYFVHRWRHMSYPIMDKGVVYPVGKFTPFSIVHQYDRDPSWNEAIKGRYQ